MTIQHQPALMTNTRRLMLHEQCPLLADGVVSAGETEHALEQVEVARQKMQAVKMNVQGK